MEDLYGRMGVLLRGQGSGVEKITRAALLHHTWVAALADFRLEHYPLRRGEDQIDLVRPPVPERRGKRREDFSGPVSSRQARGLGD